MRLNGARVALAVLLTSVAVNAATISTYTTQSAFSNAATGITLIDFASSSVAGNYSSAAGLTVGGVNFVGLDGGSGYTLQVRDSSIDPAYLWGAHVLRGGNASLNNSYIQINLAGVTAAALDLGTFWAGNPVQVTLATGESFTVNTPSSAPGAFWGFTSDTAENYIRISTINQVGSPILIDMRYGSANAAGDPPADTPEVMTMLTLGAGLLAMGGLRRYLPVSGARAA